MTTSNTSDLNLQPDNNLGLFQLPTRGEKRIIAVVTPDESGLSTNSNPNLTVEEADFEIKAALAPYYEFTTISIPGRGVTGSGQPDPTSPAVFRFLINPSQVEITREQLDAQTFTRAGWQIGVWGEDLLRVAMSGKSPGKYFSNGLTDEMTEYTLSYRNLVALELMVENNGYWFEGEQAGEGPLAAGYTRRQIKMHSDVTLTMGEFIWYGMFEELSVTEDAETPYLMEFNLTFIAWREGFNPSTPYSNPIDGAVDFGHVPGVSLAYGNANNPNSIIQTLSVQPPQLAVGIATVPTRTLSNLPTNSAVLMAVQNVTPAANLPAIDVTPTLPIMKPTAAQFG